MKLLSKKLPQKSNKNINHLNVTDLHRTLNPTIVGYTLFSSIYETSTKNAIYGAWVSIHFRIFFLIILCISSFQHFTFLPCGLCLECCLLTGGAGKNSEKAKSVFCKPGRHYYMVLNVMNPFSAVFPGAQVTVPPNLLIQQLNIHSGSFQATQQSWAHLRGNLTHWFSFPLLKGRKSICRMAPTLRGKLCLCTIKKETQMGETSSRHSCSQCRCQRCECTDNTSAVSTGSGVLSKHIKTVHKHVYAGKIYAGMLPNMNNDLGDFYMLWWMDMKIIYHQLKNKMQATIHSFFFKTESMYVSVSVEKEGSGCKSHSNPTVMNSEQQWHYRWLIPSLYVYFSS